MVLDGGCCHFVVDAAAVGSNLFEAASQEQVVRIGWNQFVTGRQDAESQEHESAHHIGPIRTFFGQGQNHVTTLQFLLGVF